MTQAKTSKSSKSSTEKSYLTIVWNIEGCKIDGPYKDFTQEEIEEQARFALETESRDSRGGYFPIELEEVERSENPED